MFSDNLRKLRLKNGISQEELGEIIDVTRQSVSKYENGTSQPSFDKLIAIAKYFDVTTDYLLMSKIDDNVITKKSDKITVVSKFDTLNTNGMVASYYIFTVGKVIGNKNSPKQLFGEPMIRDSWVIKKRCLPTIVHLKMQRMKCLLLIMLCNREKQIMNYSIL
ncbi:helix-turn-helix domain-containing protein [Companilactobacillus jidongensis]|uniref:helix-turn-helix domain-containing protein n=1 Tax=Companilactobacillus jidongensis TaxID=2486006 RepID=UPI0013DD8B8F|nr:helix-turn-helix transcriptional regulator [Companilactobacillus jidongensis]